MSESITSPGSKFERVVRRSYGCDRRHLVGLLHQVTQGKKMEWAACLQRRDTSETIRVQNICDAILKEFAFSLDEVANAPVLAMNAVRDKKVKHAVIEHVKIAITKDCDPFDENKPLGRNGITLDLMKRIIGHCKDECLTHSATSSDKVLQSVKPKGLKRGQEPIKAHA